MAQDYTFEKRLFSEHSKWVETSLTHRRFKHADILPLINKLKANVVFNVKSAGFSEQGREIFLIKAGSGKTKVFLWSQMHGDEPTATMALFDLFNFFSDSAYYKELKEEILSGLTIYFIPMVNPDGAELYQRRNINQIDINRDAVKQQSAEGRLLKSVYDSIKADFGFNLHDQSSRYSAGKMPKTTAIAFLAPPFNTEKDTNAVRNRSMKLIGSLNHLLSEFIPGHVAKYSDDFEPRAFGDNFQKWGMSTVLIESGGWFGDPEKQFLRKINFVTLISALKSIAGGDYEKFTLDDYNNIPFNDNFAYDLLLRNVRINYKDSTSVVDIAINRIEKNMPDKKSFYYTSNIEEIGDSLGFFGIEEYDMDGYDLYPGNVHPASLDSLDQVSSIVPEELLKKGELFVKVKNYDSLKAQPLLNKFPVNILFNSTSEEFKPEVSAGEKADFILKKNGVIEYVCVNGFLYDVVTKTGGIKNGSQFR